VVLSVIDNGLGLRTSDTGARRRGIANMMQRATALGGAFGVEGMQPSGSIASLVLPVRQVVDARAG
jgi:signal transduction histidine kinase